MNLSVIEERTIKQKRITRAERAVVFSRVKKPHEYLSEIHGFYSGIILAQVYNNPKYGSKNSLDRLCLKGFPLVQTLFISYSLCII